MGILELENDLLVNELGGITGGWKMALGTSLEKDGFTVFGQCSNVCQKIQE